MYYYQSERKMLEEVGIDCIQQSSTEGGKSFLNMMLLFI